MVKKIEIAACPRCGSKRIEMGTMGSGVIFGVTSWKSVCKDCGYQGEPLLFDSEQDYKNFQQRLLQKDMPDTSGDEPVSLSKKDEEVIASLKEFNEEELQEKQRDEVFPSTKDWWVEIFVAMILSLIWVLFSVQSLIFLYGTTAAIVYAILFFILVTIIILFGIVIVEFFYFSIKKKA